MPTTFFTTVATFETAPAAWIHRNYLVQNGLPAIVTDEHTVNMYWLYSHAIGGVKVQIPQSELPNYRQLTPPSPTVRAEPGSQRLPSTDFETCPDCDSFEISIVRWPKRLIFLTWLVIGFPVPIYAPLMICNECGFEKRSKFDIPKQIRIIQLLVLATLVASALGISMLLGVDWLKLVSSPAAP